MLIDKAKSFLNPDKRDFSHDTEEKLVSYCKQEQSSEIFLHKIQEFVVRVSLHFTFFKLMIANSGEWNETMADLYQYSASMIRTIFSQARSCDVYYGKSVLGDISNRAQQTNKLLENLSNVFEKKGKTGGYDIEGTRLNIINFYTFDNENVEAKKLLDTKTGLTEVSEFINSSESEDPFAGCSDDIYDKLMGGDLYIKTSNHIMKNEKNYYKMIDMVLEKTVDEDVNTLIDKIVKEMTDDEDLIALIKGTIDEAGAVDYVENYVRLIALKQVRNMINDRYQYCRNKLNDYQFVQDYTQSGLELNNTQVDNFKYLYDALKQTEIDIQSTYSKMHKNNTSIRVACNEKINEIEKKAIPNRKIAYYAS